MSNSLRLLIFSALNIIAFSLTSFAQNGPRWHLQYAGMNVRCVYQVNGEIVGPPLKTSDCINKGLGDLVGMYQPSAWEKAVCARVIKGNSQYYLIEKLPLNNCQK